MDPKNTHNEEPKTEEELRQDIVKEYNFDEEDDKDRIDRILKERKDAYRERKKRREANDLLKEQGIDPETGKPFKTDEGQKNTHKRETQKQDQKEIDRIDERIYRRDGGSKNVIRKVRQVMAGTGKSFADALQDSMVVAFTEKLEREGKSRQAQMKPARGGYREQPGEKVNETEQKYSDDKTLPPGFKPKK